ncbi:MAG: SDR family NAD(P)-dependent oxidoreductase [Desulfarculaceae bacterium]
MQIQGNKVLITGGGSGIGLALARSFAGLGNQVLICGRSQARLDQAQKEIPVIKAFQCDITQGQELKNLLGFVQKDFPDLNLLINNAGVANIYDLIGDDGAGGMAAQEIQTNLLAPIRLTQLLLPLLLKQPAAAVVNISSGLALCACSLVPGYSAAKAGLHAFTRVLRHYLTKTKVQVMEVFPPLVDTEMCQGINLPKLKAEAVARSVIKGLKNNRREIYPGMAKGLWLMSRIAPNLFEGLFNRYLARKI